VNPLTGREEHLPLKRQPEPKKIVVVGAGPAGLEAACTAAELGHKVSLFEREGRIGGQLRSASVPPHKALLETIIEYYDAQLPRLGVKLDLNEAFTEQALEREDPDVLMLATGGRPMIPSLPGIDQPNVVTAHDVLMGSVDVGDLVLVVGGGLVGSETAEYLAEGGNKVTLIEELEELAQDVEARSRPLLLERLAGLGVETITRCKLLSIEGAEARVRHEEQDRILRADSIVLAVGTEPNNDLQAKLPAGRWKLMTLGDCRTPGNIKEAIHQGFWETYKVLVDKT
jgi:pyruvate/2-oxoglutarate dehydrogenase complex dihydrolipoamide dehydrogenase (E3) component